MAERGTDADLTLPSGPVGWRTHSAEIKQKLQGPSDLELAFGVHDSESGNEPLFRDGFYVLTLCIAHFVKT